MESKLKILVADNSSAIRGLLRTVLNSEADFEVVATECNTGDTVASFCKLQPDMVILDDNLTVSNGVNAMDHLRQCDPLVPVLVLKSGGSAKSKQVGSSRFNDANAFIPRPTSTGHLRQAIEQIRTHVLPTVEEWASRVRRRQKTGLVKPVEQPDTVAVTPVGVADLNAGSQTNGSGEILPDIVAIGSSTGGPDALCKVLKPLPADLSVPILIAQHMPPKFTRLLADRLDKICSLRVREAGNGTVLEKGSIWLAPGDYHMTVQRQGARDVLLLNQDPPENSCRPSVDVLFRSVAQVYGRRTLGVVLTGMGQDGMEGCKAIKQVGGSVIAQNQSTSVVWGMPRAVAENGLADAVVPLDFISNRIIEHLGHGEAAVPNAGVRRTGTW
jgi:two-component system chemotaxis response regulator CheB